MNLTSSLKIFDISPILSHRTSVFPGDTEFQRVESMSFQKGDHLTLSAIKSTLHIGAHADAPSHYHPEGVSIDAINLQSYIGPCFVAAVKAGPDRLIKIEQLSQGLKDYLASYSGIKRVLFQTLSFKNADEWTNDFVAISPDLVDWLSGFAVGLIGIDTPSIDPAISKNLPAHSRVAYHGINLLEGLDLQNIAEGQYDLVALPLRIESGDASPVRAILLPAKSINS